MALSVSDKVAMVDKMFTVVDECDSGLKRRAEGRFRPKSLTYAIDPRMVLEVRAYFDDMAPTGAPETEAFDNAFATLGEVVRMVFTAHLDGAVYVTVKELTRMRQLIDQCRAALPQEAAMAVA
ncbi:MAG: hypothetical protein ACAI38_12075 [Myxococcota bacterium]